MRIKTNSCSGAALLWLIVIVLIVVTFCWIADIMIQAIKRIVPPPPASDQINITLGSPYDGGIIVGYTNSPGQTDVAPVRPLTVTGPCALSVYADDVPNPVAWTNCIWTTNFATVNECANFFYSLTVGDLVVLDNVTNAPARFYNISYSPPQ